MTKPLALILYEHLLPGSQLVNRLQDLGYHVKTASDSRSLTTQALGERPLLIIIDLSTRQTDACGAIRDLRKEAEIRHVPIVAFGDSSDVSLVAAATAAGATLVAGRGAIVDQIQELLEQALQVE